MRPNQQNRRMRGRNNRKGPNPLTRSYESNGPDVKIRGSAQQIADKYATLARDAQASGDRVMAENYLQHAEHYNRIIAAAQGQQQMMRENRDDRDDLDDDDQDQDGQTESGAENQADDGTGPQPVINGTPAEVALEEQAVPSGEATNGGEQRSAKPRRPRRPRREATAQSDDTPADANGSGDSAGSSDEAVLAATGS